jgi:glyoxylase-like metal-dependent hydrolase (beta-lactamase superfamily II)
VDQPHEIAPALYVLPTNVAIPGVGFLPVNAYFFDGEEPLVVDTGVWAESDGFLEALGSLVEMERLKYVLISHDDGDHTGSLQRILQAAPGAQVLTHALCALRMGLALGIPLDRVRAIVPGERLQVGTRTFRVFRPPLFDNPVTLGLHDAQDRVMFSVDCFGGLVPRPADEATDYTPDELAQSMLMWASMDDPWVAHYDRAAYAALLGEARRLDSDLVLSSHLAPAKGIFGRLLQTLEALPDVEPFAAPDQAAFAQMVAAMKTPAGAA